MKKYQSGGQLVGAVLKAGTNAANKGFKALKKSGSAKKAVTAARKEYGTTRTAQEIYRQAPGKPKMPKSIAPYKTPSGKNMGKNMGKVAAGVGAAGAASYALSKSKSTGSSSTVPAKKATAPVKKATPPAKKAVPPAKKATPRKPSM